MNISQEKQFKIGGKKRLIKFGTNATRIFCEKHGLTLSEYMSIAVKDLTAGQKADLIWSGLVAGEIKSNPDVSYPDDVEFTEWDVGNWVDEIDQDKLDEVWNLFRGPQEEDSKKKDEEA